MVKDTSKRQMTIDGAAIWRGLMRELGGHLEAFHDKPLHMAGVVASGSGTVAAVWDVLTGIVFGGSSQSWEGSGRPLFGEAFASLPARILLFVIIVSALIWTFSTIALWITAKRSPARVIAGNLWFGFGAVMIVAMVDLIFRDVLKGNSQAILLCSLVAILLSVFLIRARFMLTLETKLMVVAARTTGLALFSALACVIALVSYLTAGL